MAAKPIGEDITHAVDDGLSILGIIDLDDCMHELTKIWSQADGARESRLLSWRQGELSARQG